MSKKTYARPHIFTEEGRVGLKYGPANSVKSLESLLYTNCGNLTSLKSTASRRNCGSKFCCVRQRRDDSVSQLTHERIIVNPRLDICRRCRRSNISSYVICLMSARPSVRPLSISLSKFSE